MSSKTILLLVVVCLTATLGAVTWMILNPQIYSNNCWDKYSTEQEAILNCEGKN